MTLNNKYVLILDMATPLLIPIILMILVAPIGAIDVLYYHIFKFKLYDQPTARWETVTHLIRSVLLGLGAIVLFNFEPHGIWFWIIGGFLCFDFLNDLIDVYLEKHSRAPLGGIPRAEYMIHTVGSAFSGAIMTAYFVFGWNLQYETSHLVAISPGTLSAPIVWAGYFLVAGGIGITVLEMSLLACSLLCSEDYKSKYSLFA